MSHKGHVPNGVIHVDDPEDLPDGTLVEFEPIAMPTGRHHPDVERFAGIIERNIRDEEEYFEYLEKKHQ